MTVLGDLAQATGVAATSRWRDALEHLGHAGVAREVELTIGYRLPRAILDYANELLPVAAPHVTPARSARDEGDPPELLDVERSELAARAAARALDLAAEHVTTAVIAPPSLHDELRALLGSAAGPTVGDRLSLLEPELAKGLEFDAVVVVDPGVVRAIEPHGSRLLYVALTRAVQHLTVVSAVPDEASMSGA
jgi:DNA helicase IV